MGSIKIQADIVYFPQTCSLRWPVFAKWRERREPNKHGWRPRPWNIFMITTCSLAQMVIHSLVSGKEGGHIEVVKRGWQRSGGLVLRARDPQQETWKQTNRSHGRMNLVTAVIQQSVFPLPYHMPSLSSSNSQWSFSTISADFFKASSCSTCLVFSIGPTHGSRTSTNSLSWRSLANAQAICLLDLLLPKEVLLQWECYPGFLPSSSLHWLCQPVWPPEKACNFCNN